MKAKIRLRNAWMSVVVLIIIIGGAVFFVYEFTIENTITAKVKAVNTRIDAQMQVDKFTGSEVTHLVSTDKGVFKIQPV